MIKYYTMFVNAIARNRETDTKTVLKEMANGKIYIGNQALDAGLVDYIGDLNLAVQIANQEAKPMNITELKEKHPGVYQAAFDEENTE